MNKPPKKHHFLPQFYQKYFTNNENQLWEFDRLLNTYKQKSPKGTGYCYHYYRYKGKDGKNHTEIEDFFGSIEDKTKYVIDKLNNKTNITEEDMEILSCFVAFQKTRVPDFQKTMDESSEQMIKKMNKLYCSNIKDAKNILYELNKKSALKEKVKPEKLLKFIQNEEYYVKIPRERSIKSMLLIGYNLAKYLSKMNWTFIYATKNTSFITSDNPFYITPPSNFNKDDVYLRSYGFGTPGTYKVMPLSSSVCVAIGNQNNTKSEDSKINFNRKEIKDINCSIALNSDQFIIAKDKLHLENIVKITKVNEYIRERRVNTS